MSHFGGICKNPHYLSQMVFASGPYPPSLSSESDVNIPHSALIIKKRNHIIPRIVFVHLPQCGHPSEYPQHCHLSPLSYLGALRVNVLNRLSLVPPIVVGGIKEVTQAWEGIPKINTLPCHFCPFLHVSYYRSCLAICPVFLGQAIWQLFVQTLPK